MPALWREALGVPMKKPRRVVLGEGWLSFNPTRTTVNVLAFREVKGKCNGVKMLGVPKDYKRREYRLIAEVLEEGPGGVKSKA